MAHEPVTPVLVTPVPVAAAAAPPRIFPLLRRTWLAGTVLLSLAAVAGAVALAPPAGASPGRALASLVFLGTSVHVASTGWFYTLPQVRGHARTHRGRYVLAPAALVAGTAAAALTVPPEHLSWVLVPFLAWQFFHFQKQNLGLAALAAAALRAGPLSRLERRTIAATGWAGTVGLLAHPHLLKLRVDPHLGFAYPLALAAFAAAAAVGVAALARRERRPAGFVAVHLVSLLFFAPAFAFGNPFAAVAGLTVAHGYQYLLIMGMVSGAPRRGRPGLTGLTVMLGIGVLGGLALAYASHLHDSPAVWERGLYGAYLGAVMTHFVVDAGLWRLRDEFPRRFLTASVPYLLKPWVSQRPAAATTPAAGLPAAG